MVASRRGCNGERRHRAMLPGRNIRQDPRAPEGVRWLRRTRHGHSCDHLLAQLEVGTWFVIPDAMRLPLSMLLLSFVLAGGCSSSKPDAAAPAATPVIMTRPL